ncbi:MAG: hypothetical protein PVH88_04755 [Ignavibacteria bacterium]|jgi:hypothetical protein
MKKKLFKSYVYELDKNELKIISNFCKQAINQMQADERFYADVKAFTSIQDKINEGNETLKLTKDESIRLTRQFKENTKQLKIKLDKSNFLTKWLYKTMYNQYNSLLQNHFEN